jgi:hypothetical protein
MNSAFRSAIQDSSLAAIAQLSENSRLGFATKDTALHQGIAWSKSTLALGLPEWSGKTASGPAVAANNGQPAPNDCRYVDPLSAGIEITGKFGPGLQVGPVDVGLNMFTHTLGEAGTGSSVDLGFKGLLSLQGKRDNAWASNPLSWSFTILGFNHSSSGWSFQPSKEFKLGLQAIVGFEIGWNSDKFKAQVDRNIACGYKNGPPQ